MYVFSTFDHSIYLELAVTALEEKGIGKDRLLAVPLNRRTERALNMDTIHRSDGVSLFDLAAVFATVGMVLGVTYGFVLVWGPVLCGLLASVAGFAIGYTIDRIMNKRRVHKENTSSKTEVILLVHCHENEVEMVNNILWSNKAFGVAQLDHNPPSHGTFV
ncbi:MAG TPA: hypothetical protein VGE40_03970 [Bacilli bacterium]